MAIAKHVACLFSRDFGFNVEGIVRPGQTDPMRLENWQPWIPSLVMAKGTGNIYKHHGMDWDSTGGNGYYAQFQQLSDEAW